MSMVLLDTHCLIWALTAPEKLSSYARHCLTDLETEALVSFVSLWEMAIKMSLDKLPEIGRSIQAVTETMQQEGFRLIWPDVADLSLGLTLPLYHRDPFDRLLIAQAVRLRVPLLSSDRVFSLYKVDVRW